MARRSRKSARRGTFATANDVWSLLRPSEPLRSGRLLEIEDRRRFNPLSVEVLRTPRKRLRVTQVKKPGGKKLRPGFFFNTPKFAVMCVRRKERKEVLHARGVAGSKVRKPRRNQWSSVKCGG